MLAVVDPFRTLQAANLAMLGVLAGLVVAMMLGQTIPRALVAAVLVAQLGLRVYRDLRWGGAPGRRRLPGTILLSTVLLILILTAR